MTDKPIMRFRLYKIRLNRGGYTDNGEYFGTGEPLYGFISNDDNEHGNIRAHSRNSAKLQIMRMFPGVTCTFYK